MKRRLIRASADVVVCLSTPPPTLPAQDESQPLVRQIVIFKFLPGRAAEAIHLFRESAVPLYEKTAPMLQFRGYREAESPEPLDLVVVSTFRGMLGQGRQKWFRLVGSLVVVHKEMVLVPLPELSVR